MAINDHVVGLISAVATVGAVLGHFCGFLLRWVLRLEHRLTRLEQEVFEESAT